MLFKFLSTVGCSRWYGWSRPAWKQLRQIRGKKWNHKYYLLLPSSQKIFPPPKKIWVPPCCPLTASGFQSAAECWESFQLFSNLTLNTYYVPGAVLGAEVPTMTNIHGYSQEEHRLMCHIHMWHTILTETQNSPDFPEHSLPGFHLFLWVQISSH